jgi:hypothetical protein
MEGALSAHTDGTDDHELLPTHLLSQGLATNHPKGVRARGAGTHREDAIKAGQLVPHALLPNCQVTEASATCEVHNRTGTLVTLLPDNLVH